MEEKKQKKIIIIAIVIFVLLVGFGISYYFYQAGQNNSNNSNNNNQISSTTSKTTKKNLDYYKNVFSGTFFKYEDTISQVKKKGSFDFEINLAAEGDINKILSGIMIKDDFNSQDFKNISLETYGDYDITDPQKASFNIYLKMFLNKDAVGLGDFDININVVSSGDVEYTINNLDQKFIDFVTDNSEISKDLLIEFQKVKQKKLHTKIPAEVLPQFVAIIESLNPEAMPLYKDTKEQEKAIQDAFIESETINVITGQTLDNGEDKLQIAYDGSNFVDFMNEVSKIVNTGDNVVNFDSEREIFKNMFSFQGVMNIKNYTIQDSSFVLEFMISGINKDTNKKQYQVIANTINFKAPNPEIFDITIKDTFGRYAEILNEENINLLTGQQSLSPDKLNITFRGLVK